MSLGPGNKSKRRLIMAAASFLVPSLSGWSSRPNRIRHSPQVNFKRRPRVTPPLSNEEIEKRLKIDKELEVVQERHIRRKIREYLKPFRLFLTAIGRFPYSFAKEEFGNKRNMKMVVEAVKKTSCAPIIEIGVINEDDTEEANVPVYKYAPKSIRGFMFFFTTCLAIVTMILAIIGYIDLSLTVHKFQDIIEKEINGELTCNKTVRYDDDEPSSIRRNVRNALFLPFMKDLNPAELNHAWNCTYAVKMLSSCFATVVNMSTQFSQGDETEADRISACEIAIRLKKFVDDNMIFLIVIFACVLNVILQATIPLFNGKKSADFLTSWSEDLSSTRFDVSGGIRKRVISELLFLALFESVLVCLYFSPPEVFSSSNTHFVQDAVRAARIVLLRPFKTDPEDISYHSYFVELPIFLAFLIHIASYKGYVFFYVCVCRSLSNGFKEWNKKASDIFAYKKRQRDYSRHDGYPCSLDHLVNSHFILLKLVKDANDILGVIVGSYFATQVIIICFETYFLVDVGLNGGWLTICALAIMLQTSFIVIMVALSASYVHEEAMNGFEALRGAYRNHLTSEEERMLQTLLTSFSGPPIMLSGGKFFGLHRPFLLTVIGVIITYFVVIVQMIKLT